LKIDGDLLMKYVKRFFMAVTFLAVGSFVWWAGMNYTGYCHAEGRYLSDEEKIDSAVQHVLAGYSTSVEFPVKIVNGSFQRGPKWDKSRNTIRYKDANEFFEENPDCCKFSMVIGEGYTASIIDRIFGYISTFVTIRYKVRYFDDDNIERYNDGGQAVAIKNCGQAW
jgi:hypothetical protein